MPKYWGKQIFKHGRFPEVGQKQKTEREKRQKEEERLNDGDNNGQAIYAWHTQARMAHARRTQARMAHARRLSQKEQIMNKIKLLLLYSFRINLPQIISLMS